jgi:hypothetical protein
VRRALRWLAGLAGLAALIRLLAVSRRRRLRETPSAPGRDPATELRRKLDEARVAGPPAPTPDGPPAASRPVSSPVSIEERRARIHRKAQEAIELMENGR